MSTQGHQPLEEGRESGQVEAEGHVAEAKRLLGLAQGAVASRDAQTYALVAQARGSLAIAEQLERLNARLPSLGDGGQGEADRLQPEQPEQIGRRIREGTERACGGELSPQDRLVVETVIADVVRENFCPCGVRIERGAFMCPSCLEHAEAD